MKLTRHEILLVIALLSALAIGALVKQFRAAHPLISAPGKSIPQK